MCGLAIFVYSRIGSNLPFCVLDQTRLVTVCHYRISTSAPRKDHGEARAPPFLQEQTESTQPGSHQGNYTAGRSRTKTVEEIPSWAWKQSSAPECCLVCISKRTKGGQAGSSRSLLVVAGCHTKTERSYTS